MTCAVCNQPLPPPKRSDRRGRPRKFCSAAHRMAAVYWRAQHDGAELPEGGLDQYNGRDAAIQAERIRQSRDRARRENERYAARRREVEEERRLKDPAAPFRVSVPERQGEGPAMPAALPAEQHTEKPEPEEIAHPRITII